MSMEEGRPTSVRPLTMSSPITDDEMVRDESAPPLMTERPDNSLPQNGQHLSKHDDNDGLIVPLDELVALEKERGGPLASADVENTRL